MKEDVLSRRYARALFELAKERQILANIRKEIEFFHDNLSSNQDLKQFLGAREISKKEKIRTIEKLFQDRVSNVFFNFVLLLLRKNRQVLFPTIFAEFGKLFDRHNKKVRARAYTAVPLEPLALANLKGFLDREFNADVEIENLTDLSIIAGLVVDVNGRVFNSSLQNQLGRLKRQLTEDSRSRVT